MTIYPYTEGGDVSSSAFEAVYYDEDLNTLYVVFTNGRVAAYIVLSSTFHSMQDSGSLGRFYNQYIYGHAAGTTVDQDCLFQRRLSIEQPESKDVTKAVEVTTHEDEILEVVPKVYDYKVYYNVISDECDVVSAVSVDDAIAQVENEFRSVSINVTKVEVEFD